MRINTEEVLNEVINKMRDILEIRANDIPNIELYMDQVTTFMDEKLRYTVRAGESEEKILTKTMKKLMMWQRLLNLLNLSPN